MLQKQLVSELLSKLIKLNMQFEFYNIVPKY